MTLPINDIPILQPGARILFQGDSITDGSRGRSLDPNHILGHGYAFLIAAKYGALYPELNLTFLNRGISGNTVRDLTARWTEDTLYLKPDILSILIGVNDAGRAASGQDDGTAEQYERDYNQLLTDTKATLPGIRFILCEPFLTQAEPGSKRQIETVLRQQAAARIAALHGAAFVRLQHIFDDAAKRAPADYWLWDGVHPTYSGHQLIADEWERVVSQGAP